MILMTWLISASLQLAVVHAAESIPPAIEQAQTFAMKKNRQEAASVLRRAIQAAPVSPKSRIKYTESLANISKIFFTDKGQRLFEAGQSSMFETPDIALGQFRDSLLNEDDNVLVLANMARVQMVKQDCPGALVTLKKARDLNPYWSEAALLELRTLLCLKNFEAFREKHKALPPLEKGQEPFVQYLVAQDFMQQQMWRKATEILGRVTEDAPKFPESYYWLSKATIELESDGEAFAQKYVTLCKGVGVRERKLFAYEPKLCSFAKEVEDELVKKNAEL